MSDAAAIECFDVSKRYDDGDRRIEAVANISLRIEKGTLTILRGPSGSGKTTLLGLMGGMVVPTKGSVSLLGKPTTNLRDHHRTRIRRELVGFIFQELALIPKMNLLENVLLPCVPDGNLGPETHARAMALLTRFGLESRARTPIERLSGGERQRGALARALIKDAPLLFLDEPTAHLDSPSVNTLVEILEQLKADDRTLIVSTHDERLTSLARVDRLVSLRDGRIVSESDAVESL